MENGIDISDWSDKGEGDLDISSCLDRELAGESGQKFLEDLGVRKGDGRFCLSDRGEEAILRSRHFLDLGVVPCLVSIMSGVTLALSADLLVVIVSSQSFINLQNIRH